MFSELYFDLKDTFPRLPPRLELLLQLLAGSALLPGLPVKVVNQFFGEVFLLRAAATKAEFEPVQVAAALLLGDRAVLAGAVQYAQIVRLPQEGIDRAPLEVGALDGKGRLRTIIVRGICLLYTSDAADE